MISVLLTIKQKIEKSIKHNPTKLIIHSYEKLLRNFHDKLKSYLQAMCTLLHVSFVCRGVDIDQLKMNITT